MKGHNFKGIALVAIIVFFHFSALMFLNAVAHRDNNENVSRVWDVADEAMKVEMPGFTATAYCPGSCCNGVWAGLTATGRSMDYYTNRNIHIAAVDPNVIPLGSLIEYDGMVYLAVDVGGKIKGKRIDILVPDHEESERFGVKKDRPVSVLYAGDIREPMR